MDFSPVIFLLEFIPRKQIRQLEKEIKYNSTHQSMTQKTRNDINSYLFLHKIISWYINPLLFIKTYKVQYRMHTFYVIEYNGAIKIKDSEICMKQ